MYIFYICRQGSIIAIFSIFFIQPVESLSLKRAQLIPIIGFTIERNMTYTEVGYLHVGDETVDLFETTVVPEEDAPERMSIFLSQYLIELIENC